MKKLAPYIAATALLSSCVIGGNKTVCPEVQTDTVYTKCDELDSLSWKFSFNTTEAMQKFKSEIEDKLGTLMEINTLEVDTNKEIKVSYIPTETINIQDTSDYIVLTDTTKESDSTESTVIDFNKDAHITIHTSLPYHFSPFRTLAVDSALSNIKVNRMGNITTLSLRPASMVNGNSIDIIEQWSKFLTKYPAAGKAIMGNIEGLAEAAKGNAMSIRGLTPSSMNAISITTSYSHGDISPEKMLLMPGMSGLYCEGGNTSTTTYAIAQAGSKPHAAKVTVSHHKNFDPVISYSMKKSDAVLVYKKSNINDIKRRSSANSVAKIDNLLFFLSINSNLSEELREMISSKIAPLKILNQLDVEGETIERIENREESTPYNFGGNVFTSPSGELRLIFPTDNPIASEAAASIAYNLNKEGIKVSLVDSEGAYERGLYENNFDIALCAINETQLSIKGIESYIANYWFSGEKNETSRITSFKEVPLFSVSLFLAMQNDVSIFEKSVKQIYKQ